MTKKEIVVQLKKMLGLFNEEAEANLAKIYQEDEIKISAFEVGGKVELIDGNGELTVAPDGDYELADGSKFSVKDGLIESIEGQEAPEESTTEDVEVVAEEAPAEEAPQEDSKVAELEAKVARLETEIAEIKKLLEGTDADNAEFLNQMTELNKNMALLAETPAQFSQVNKSQKEKESREEKLSAFAKILGSVK